MSELQIFLYGAMGGFSVDVLNLYNISKSGEHRFLRSTFFWIVAVLLACLAGGMAVALEAHSLLQAVYIGAAAPSILRQLVKNVSVEPARPEKVNRFDAGQTDSVSE